MTSDRSLMLRLPRLSWSPTSACMQDSTRLQRVMNNGIDVSVEIYERFLMNMASGQHDFAGTPLNVLSDRELEVTEFTGSGHGTREIAERLQFSIRMVESY